MKQVSKPSRPHGPFWVGYGSAIRIILFKLRMIWRTGVGTVSSVEIAATMALRLTVLFFSITEATLWPGGDPGFLPSLGCFEWNHQQWFTAPFFTAGWQFLCWYGWVAFCFAEAVTKVLILSRWKQIDRREGPLYKCLHPSSLESRSYSRGDTSGI